MKIETIEKIKFLLDVGITTFTLIAAVCAILSLIYNSKLEYAKKLEDNQFRLKIAQSNATAAKAKEEAANALSSAAQTNEKSKILELQLESQKERANKSELELLILKDRIKPRSLTQAQTENLILQLKDFSKREIQITSSIGDGEASNYALEFTEIFKEAGWNVDSVGIGMSMFTGIGTYLFVSDSKMEGAGKLQKIFAKVGIELKGEILKDITKMQLFIGSKSNAEEKNNLNK